MKKVENPIREKKSTAHALRGGSWLYVAGWCRAACRGMGVARRRHGGFGFRPILRSLELEKNEEGCKPISCKGKKEEARLSWW
jgi:hypothetical protein